MKNKHLIYRIIEYGINKVEFDLVEMIREFKLTYEEEQYVKKLVWDTHSHPSPQPNQIIIKVPSPGAHQADWRHMLLPDAVFQYNDYLEIVEARKTAQEARKLSWIAIWFSSIIGLFSLIIGGLQLYFQFSS